MSRRNPPSDTRLVISSHRGWGAVVLMMVFVAMGLLVWLYRPLLTCDHETATCTLNANAMPGNPQQVLVIADIDKAGIQTRQHSEHGLQSRVVLEVAGRPVQIGTDWSDKLAAAETMAERINGFLKTEESGALTLIPNRGVHYGSLAFIAIALLLALIFGFTVRHYRSLFDKSQDYYRIETRGWLHNTSVEGKLGAITGTLEKSAGNSQKNRRQLGILDAECRFHPILVPLPAGNRCMRDNGARIRHLLALDDTRSLKSWDLRPRLDELAKSIGRTAAQTEELANLEAELEKDPFNIELLRQVGLRLKRLGRSDEASKLLRARHRSLIEQHRRAEANLLAGIVWTIGLQG